MILHLFTWEHKRPLSSLIYDSAGKNALLPQLNQPESRIAYLPVEKYIFIIRKNNSTVFPPSSSNSSGPACRGVSLPSNTSTTSNIPDNAEQAVCQSFPNGWEFLGQKIHTGHVHLLCHMDMDSSSQIYQEARNMEVMWSFRAFTIWQNFQNLST